MWCKAGGLSNTQTLHWLPVRDDPVTRQPGPFMAPSMAKGQPERGPSQLGKRWGGRVLPRLSPTLLSPTAVGRCQIPHARGARGDARTHGTCGTAGPGVLGDSGFC